MKSTNPISRHFVEGKLEVDLQETESAESALSEALRNFCLLQKSGIHGLENGRARMAEMPKFCYQEELNFLFSESVLAHLGKIDGNSGGTPGYLVVLDHFRPTYRTGGLVGRWSPEQVEVWTSFMGGENGRRDVRDGRLFRHLWRHGVGQVFLPDERWEASQYTSEEVKPLRLGYAVVTPLLHQGKILGVFTMGFTSAEAARSSAELLYRVGQLTLAQVILPGAGAVEERTLISTFVRIFRPTATRARDHLGYVLGELQALLQETKAAEKPLASLKHKLRELMDLVEQEALRPCQFLDLFSPDLEAEKYEPYTADVLAKELRNLCEMLFDDPEADFERLTTVDCVNLEVNFSGEKMMPSSFVTVSVIELMSNAIRAIGELMEEEWEGHSDMESIAIGGPEVRDAYRERRGEPPRIDLSLTVSDAEILCLEVTDNGIGMPAIVRERAQDWGFSGRRGLGGTGVGLTIVRLIAGALSGSLRLEGRAEEEVAPQDVFTRVSLEFSIGEWQ